MYVDTGEHLNVWDSVLPSDAEEFFGAGGVEVIQLPGMVSIDSPRFAAVYLE